jgi:hypothetical protein
MMKKGGTLAAMRMRTLLNRTEDIPNGRSHSVGTDFDAVD